MAVAFELVLVDEDTQTTRVTLAIEKAAIVGRADSCDVWLPQLSVSREHARISIGDAITVQDLGSANGTRVGGRRLAKYEVATVRLGEAIQFGNVVGMIRCHGAVRAGGADIVWN